MCFFFPSPLNFFYSPQLIFGRPFAVNRVKLKRTDPPPAKPPQAPLARLPQVGRLAVRHPLIRSRTLQSSLRRDHQLFRIRVERLRDNFFADRGPVRIPRVNKINPQFIPLPKDSSRLSALRRVS